MPDLITIAFIGLAGLGLALFWRGWRGRRIDNHPWCRKCRFDLKGVWPGAPRCPECGIDLERIDAVELGQRERRPVWAVAGAVLLLLCTVWLGLGVWRFVAPIDWTTYKPDWWLDRESRSADAGTAERALKELNARIGRGEVSGARVAGLVRHALDLQADESAAWLEGWGDIVIYAWGKGALTNQQALDFAQRALTIALEPALPVVRQWEITSLAPSVTLQRTGAADLTLRLAPTAAAIGATELPIDPKETIELRVRRRGIAGSRSLQAPVIVEPGEYEIEVSWSVSLAPRTGTANAAVWDIHLAAPIKVIAPAEGAAELVMDQQTDEALRACIDVQAVGLRWSEAPSGRSASSRVVVVVTIRKAPIAARIQIAAWADQAARVVRQSQPPVIMPGRSYQWRHHLTNVQDGAASITVTIEPRLDAPSRSGGIFVVQGRQPPEPDSAPETEPFTADRIWFGGPIEFANVPIQWFDSIDDANLTGALREIATMPAGWNPLEEPPAETQPP
ncbi:MAG: hypothetical protein KJZ69_18495 [Phycisphaerales bacterium]|nr:hypothetical protein [Phycisphaerales bacterium]